jgi:hypothetical protein
MPRQKKPRGRPVKYQLPEPIDSTPEEVARIVLSAKPKTTWRFEEEAGLTKEDRPD